MNQFLDLMDREPIIPAVKDEASLAAALTCRCPMVFVLCGDILNIDAIIDRLHQAGKKAVIHIDLVQGLAPKEIAVDFLHRCSADGIISTRPHLIRRGRELGLGTVLRVFAIDSKAVSNLRREAAEGSPDAIEVLPGAMPQVLSRLSREVRIPLIAGGLLSEKADVLAALGAGARCVSTSDSKLWDL